MSLDIPTAVIAQTWLQFEDYCQREEIHPHSKGVIWVRGASDLRGRDQVRPVWLTTTHPQREQIRRELDILHAAGRVVSFADKRQQTLPPEERLAVKPTLCRVVLYRSKTGRYSLAADVIGVQASLHRAGVDAGHVPDLDSDSHVHLLVKTPGRPGFRLPGTDPSIAADPMGGTYVEYNIPFWDPPADWYGDYESQPAGTWTWPPRA